MFRTETGRDLRCCPSGAGKHLHTCQHSSSCHLLLPFHKQAHVVVSVLPEDEQNSQHMQEQGVPYITPF